MRLYLGSRYDNPLGTGRGAPEYWLLSAGLLLFDSKTHVA
jgi:hypothetical protein